jgi:hypothetical protein
MSKRPIPTLKSDDALENFINETPQAQTQVNTAESTKTKKTMQDTYVKKSLVLKSSLDDALRLEAAKTKIKQITIMEEAITEYLKKKGYENI